jgi:hypothetical protein
MWVALTAGAGLGAAFWGSCAPISRARRLNRTPPGPCPAADGNFRWGEYKLLAQSVLIGAPFGYCIGGLVAPPAHPVWWGPRRQRAATLLDPGLGTGWHHAHHPAGWKYHLQRPSAKMGIFMFGTAALAYTSMQSAGLFLRAGTGGWGGGAHAGHAPPWHT